MPYYCIDYACDDCGLEFEETNHEAASFAEAREYATRTLCFRFHHCEATDVEESVVTTFRVIAGTR